MNVWDRWPGEPSRWFDRFECYRALGPGRSVDGAFAAWRAGLDARAGGKRGAKGREGSRANRHWYAAAQRWEWERRATAYDDHWRAELRAAEEARRFDARQRRLSVVAGLLDDVAGALAKLDLSELDGGEVLALLPQLRVLLKDLVQMERMEFGEASEIAQGSEDREIAEEVRAAIAKAYGEG